MITSLHTLLYSDDPEATRAFLRDVLDLPFAVDAGTDEGWLIFRTGPSEMGVHPTHAEHNGQVYESTRHHELSLMCDDLDATIAELTAKGASFVGEPSDRGWGLVTLIEVPGIDPIALYEPKHPTAYDL